MTINTQYVKNVMISSDDVTNEVKTKTVVPGEVNALLQDATIEGVLIIRNGVSTLHRRV